MLSKKIYQIRQTQNANFASEECGINLPGKYARIMMVVGNNALPNGKGSAIRIYVVDEFGRYPQGPVLGLEMDDLE